MPYARIVLLDLLQTLATPAPSRHPGPLAHRRLGCVGDSVRTGSRARRCRRAWTWELAPFGEAARDRRLLRRVAGFTDWRA